MADYNRDRSGGGGRGGRSFGGGFGGGRDSGRPSFGGRGRSDGDRPQMHKAICGECGDPCEVPFRPSGDRPVLCRDCFGGNDRKGPSRDNNSFGDRDRAPRRDSRDSREPRRDSFKEMAKDNSKEQLDMLNAKLDKILKLITPVTSVSKEKHAEVTEKVAKATEKAANEVEKATKVKKAAKKTKKEAQV